MPQFSYLASSLTKHGAYKIAFLMQAYPVADILIHIQNQSDGIIIDHAQAINTLSIDGQGIIPPYWQEAKNTGYSYLCFVTFFSIVFSHGELIDFFKNQNIQHGIGAVSASPPITGKAFSNLKACARELGFLTNDSTTSFNVDFSNHLTDIDSGKLLLSILAIKAELTDYQFTTNSQLITDLISQRIHYIFGLTANDFSNWLLASITATRSAYQQPIIRQPTLNTNFQFTPSSQGLSTDPIVRQLQSTGSISIDRRHSQLQNKLYNELKAAYPGIQISLEQSTGLGTFIDLVSFSNNHYQLYEIKTASTLWACVREALPQLLEYQYTLWLSGNSSSICLATEHSMDESVELYIDYLKDTYDIILNYRQIVL